jgi:hypothetical protein
MRYYEGHRTGQAERAEYNMENTDEGEYAARKNMHTNKRPSVPSLTCSRIWENYAKICGKGS